MRSVALSLVLAAGVASHVACGDGKHEDGFCGALDVSPGCGGELETCRDKSAADRIAYPLCVAQQDALEACLAELELACEPGIDFNVYANGDGVQDMDVYPYIGSYRLNIRDSVCGGLGRELEECRSCGGAVGFGEDAGGIGDPCDAETDCASDLQCFAGGCTRECGEEVDCLPKHGIGNCETVNGRVNVCDNGMCTTYCHGVGYEINPCPPE